MGVVRLTGTVADPQHVARRAVPISRGGIDTGERLLVGQKQGLMTGIEIRGLKLRMTLKIEPAGTHETQRFQNTVGEFHISTRLRAIFNEPEHPLMHAAETGVPTACKRSQQIEGRGRLSIGFKLTPRVGRAGAWREFDVIDDVAAVTWQVNAIARLRGRGTRLGKLAGDATKFYHRQAARISEHRGHLQKQTEEIADIVGAVLSKALGAIATLQEKGVTGGNTRKRLFQAAGLAGKHQGRKARKLPFNLTESLQIRIGRELDDRLLAPAVECPTLSHDGLRAYATSMDLNCRPLPLG